MNLVFNTGTVAGPHALDNTRKQVLAVVIIATPSTRYKSSSVLVA